MLLQNWNLFLNEMFMLQGDNMLNKSMEILSNTESIAVQK